MRRMGWLGVALIFLSVGVSAAEVGLVTALSGVVKLQEEKSAASVLGAFVKLREGDRLTLQGNVRLQIVFFDGGREETWLGAGTLAVGRESSQVVKGSLQSAIRTLPAILVKQLAKTPSSDGPVKVGMIRMRSIQPVTSLEPVEAEYAELRKQAAADDRNPELYLLASYFELREFEKLDGVLKRLDDANPGDAQLAALKTHYSQAVSKAKMPDGR
ncbi:MAG: hypothetical protein WAZ34_11065 [Rhodocyclaceae bacterium]